MASQQLFLWVEHSAAIPTGLSDLARLKTRESSIGQVRACTRGLRQQEALHSTHSLSSIHLPASIYQYRVCYQEYMITSPQEGSTMLDALTQVRQLDCYESRLCNSRAQCAVLGCLRGRRDACLTASARGAAAGFPAAKTDSRGKSHVNAIPCFSCWTRAGVGARLRTAAYAQAGSDVATSSKLSCPD